MTYHWRKHYDHKPSEDELVEDVIGLINQETDRMILQGFKIPVKFSMFTMCCYPPGMKKIHSFKS